MNMRGIIHALILLLIERDLLILEDNAHVDQLCGDIFDAMQETELISLGAWLSDQLIRSSYVVELFASDKELSDLLREL